MIDVKRTILETIKDKINKMRFLGFSDSNTFKNILYLIVLDDIYDWSDYLDDSLSVLKLLQDLRNDFILKHSDFLIQYCDFLPDYYVNVNTPQTNMTWKRVWDAPDVISIDLATQIPSPTTAVPFTPDPACPVSITYFGEGESIPSDSEGKPNVDFATLTICEKMNIYINRETGKMFFLDPQTCTWKSLRGEFASQIRYNLIIEAPEVYNGIEHYLDSDTNEFVVGLTNSGDLTSSVPVTDSNPDPDLNADLNDIL